MTEAAGIRGAEWFAAGTASWLSLTRSFRGGAWRTSTGAARRRSLQERPRSRDRRPSPTDRRPRRRVGPEMPLASALPVCRGIAARSGWRASCVSAGISWCRRAENSEMPPRVEGPALAAREVGRPAVVAVHRVIPRAVTRAMNDTLDASGRAASGSSSRDIVHDTRCPCLTAGGTLSYPGQRTTRAGRGPSSGCSGPPLRILTCRIGTSRPAPCASERPACGRSA